MPDSNRNRHGEKNIETENRTGKNPPHQQNYRKLPDKPANRQDESISTAGDTSDPKYARINKRKEDKEREQSGE